MKYLRLLLLLPLVAAVAACGGKGSSAPAPKNFQMVPQDGQFYMTWDALPGVEYWVFCAPDASTIDSHSASYTHSGWFYYTKVFAGSFYATGLSNTRQYACTVNGRYDSGPGGPDATPQVATARYAGATAASWNSGASTALSGMNVRAVAYGMPAGLNLTTDQFVAVGAGGKIAVTSALDADAKMAWSAPTQPLSDVATDLNAVIFYPSYSRFVAVGAGGKVAYATNVSTWTASTVDSTEDVNALALGSGTLVAVGNSGLIRTSTNGINWSPVNAVNTGVNLRSVAYAPLANGASSSPYWIAVGDGGVILKSKDNGQNWTPVSSGTTNSLSGVAVLPVTNTSTNVTTYILVAAGDAGTLRVSSDNGDSWQAATSVVPSAGGFVHVSAGKGQFMAVDAAGMVYTSADGLGWNGSASGLSQAPATVIRYNASVAAYSNGWMVFDTAGNQRLAK